MQSHRRPQQRRLRRFLVVAAAALAVGFASNDAATAGSDGGGSTGPGSTADTGGQGASAGGIRVVEHARGETEVVAEPQRVVVLEPVALDTAVALDVMPVGTAVLAIDTGVPDYLGADAADIAVVGTTVEPNLEAIAALDPDLIIGTETRHSDLYDKLSEIGPTVFIASQADPWKDNVAQVANALGDEDQAQQLLDEYDERCAEIAEAYDTEGQTAQLIRPREDVLTLYGPTSFAGSTLECAGFTTPTHEWEDISLDLSTELVVDAGADLVLVTTTDVNDPSTIPAVIRDNAGVFPNAHAVDFAFWITGVGPLGGMAVLDDLESILAGER